jgi:hypothetical protein
LCQPEKNLMGYCFWHTKIIWCFLMTIFTLCPANRLPELIIGLCQACHNDIWLTSRGSTFITRNSRYLPQDITTNQKLSQLSPWQKLPPLHYPHFMKGSCTFYRFIKWLCSKTVKWHNKENAILSTSELISPNRSYPKFSCLNNALPLWQQHAENTVTYLSL